MEILHNQKSLYGKQVTSIVNNILINLLKKGF